MKAERVRRASYTLESKLEAVRLVQGSQSCAATGKVLGIPCQTLENWVRQAAKGQLADAGAKPVSAEQMELTRLRAELGKSEDEARHFKKRRWRTCSHAFQSMLAEYSMHSSMSGKANCWDNAPIESLWRSLKVDNGLKHAVRQWMK